MGYISDETTDNKGGNIMTNEYMKERFFKLKKDIKMAISEAERLLITIELNNITSIEPKANTQNKYWLNIRLNDGFTYYTRHFNKDAYTIFLDILPLDKHSKMKDPIVFDGLLNDVDCTQKVFKR